MDNLLSYIKWRGDLSFKERSFNEVDSLVCALLSYVEWDDIINGDTSMKLKDACQAYCNKYTKEQMAMTYAYAPMIVSLIEVLQSSVRFAEITVKKYVSVLDEKKVAQFAAVTLEIPYHLVYLSFRGTDSSILGWKEDFEMTYQDIIPSQTLALDYLKHAYVDIVEEKTTLGFKRKRIKSSLYLGGHSKGGNLAMYAALCNEEMKEYITQVHSFDGPGFQSIFFEQYHDATMLEKIVNYVPISSIIGRLLDHQERYVIVDGYESGILQHDGFYWKVNHTSFDKAESFSHDSNRVQKYLSDSLFSKTREERKKFISFLFTVLEDLDINSITDFTEIGLKQGIRGINELMAMSSADRKLLFEMLKIIFSQSKAFLLSKLSS